MTSDQAPTNRAARAIGPLARLARWTTTHGRPVVVVWVIALVVAMGAAKAAGPNYVNNLSLAGTGSQRAADLLAREFPAQAGDTDEIVLHTAGGPVGAAAVQRRVTPMLETVSRLPHVTAVASPYAPGHAGQISRDGRTAFATIAFDERAEELPKAAVERVVSTARAAGGAGLQIELGGRAIQEASRPSLGAATAIGLLAAIVILLITFGSALAAGLPVVTALLGLGTALGLIGLESRLLDTPDFSTQLAALLGLGVGIDYALFVVTRFREAYAGGLGVPAAIDAAMDTAGRAVLFAGVTVIIALLGMFVLGVGLLNAAAVAAALAVALTMTAALTVLPVLLSRFGERIGRNAPRRGGGRSREPFWPRWARAVSDHPWPALIAGLAVMGVLAIPALSLRLGQSDSGNDPVTLTSRRAYDLLAAGFGPGFNGPLQVVASLHRGEAAQATARIETALHGAAGIASVAPPMIGPSGRTAVFAAYPTTSPESEATAALVERLRARTLPALEGATGSTLLVGGSTATGIDFASVLGAKLPLFIAVVILLAGLLLVVVFRSIAVPLQAAAMNLLSVGASLGVVVAVFQYGWLGGFFNVRAGPIEAFIPVILFAIVFGLSMDYEVFLISRIHEAWLRRGDAREALVDGIGSTGRVVTAAATIMVCVFISFVFGDQRIVKLFGLSLASAVFLDAFVVRSLLLPSTLTLLGRRTWLLPRVLDRRLPRISIEPPLDAVGAVAIAEEAS